MDIEKNIFMRYLPIFEQLLKYGFKKIDNNYYFEKSFKEQEFKACIKITSDNRIICNVFDEENNEEYLPIKYENSEGSFIGKLREEYINILIDIRDNCFHQKNFISNQANKISDLILQEIGDSPVFMWKKFPSFGVFKNSTNNKWYGIIMYIEKQKIQPNVEGMVEIINVKIEENKIKELIKKEGFFPAWHMNKKYWITIALDETLSDDIIMELIKESYSNTVCEANLNNGSSLSTL